MYFQFDVKNFEAVIHRRVPQKASREVEKK